MDTKYINVGSLVASATNRKFFDADRLDELAANISEVGILQPLLVRPLDDDRFEIVFGERRWRAAKLAGLESVECRVRELSDTEALELQVVENLQREDVDPVEEAQMLRMMLNLEQDGERVYTTVSLGEKIGKSKHYVSQRVLLAQLPRPIADALRTGKIQAKTAELIGRIPNKSTRKEVGDFVLKGDLTFKATKELIQRSYVRSLKSAPFDRESVDLCPQAGACGECPKRTGNMDLEDVRDGWVCCDMDCFRAKCEASWERQTAKAREAGMAVLSDEESRSLFVDGRHLNYDAPYVLWESRPPEDIIKPEVEWRNLESWSVMLADVVSPVLARVPDTGRSVELARLDVCLTAAVEQGEGEIFKDVILRKHAASAGGGAKAAFVNPDLGGDFDGADSEPVGEVSAKADRSQKEALQAMKDLRDRVAGLAGDTSCYVAPGQMPIECWALLLQAAAVNMGAAGRKLFAQWMGLNEDAMLGLILRGELPAGDLAECVPVALLSVLVSEWEPHMQDKFLSAFRGYVAPDEVAEESAAEELDLPEGYRPAALVLPDDEITCNVICADGSKAMAYSSTDENDVTTWCDAVSFEPLKSEVVGWEYYDGEEEEEA
ncbi:ParB/RepB/Spo0J family partition protein [Coraliomargarita sp. SDUM461003]|uniref:ParB/RepB/Spo0J family partition protein n=1 Tax=Thalassobacterium maritimum TaxID=3041265 RepID=A0ABU1APY2_9BACT|nr:ParB/RepB/Spo0J family partition protein [Coraliomargarita sp. SDUM461003]MDQ8206200.1 ParB/RepB/Spo0J family partition protein [Coraliomargarita sp. SDUM461003]